jgi:hypothetical protein
VILNSLGRSKDSGSPLAIADQLALMGYVALRFDFRGSGESEGPRGRIICLEQVADTQAAITYIAGREDVQSERIGLIGDSFGGVIAIYTAGIDNRVSAVICASGWGNGERKFRRQHPTPEAWAAFRRLLEDGRGDGAEAGTPTLVSRYAIVPVPERLRRHFGPTDPQEFPLETARSLYDFRPEEMVERIAPRPLLLLHGSVDSVTPVSESLALFERAPQSTELHILAGVDHFMFDEPNPYLWALVSGWLQAWFPARLSDGHSGEVEEAEPADPGWPAFP